MLSPSDIERADTYTLQIAESEMGPRRPDPTGWRFGSSGALVVFNSGAFYDYRDGGKGRGALALIRHFHPRDDAEARLLAFLAHHPGDGDFTPGEEPSKGATAEDDIERTAFLKELYDGATTESATLDIYVTKTRELRVLPEDRAQLRWLEHERGDEGAMVAPFLDEGAIVALHFTYITPSGEKSSIKPARRIYRGPTNWSQRGFIQLGRFGKTVYLIEGLEKGWAVRLGGAEYVLVTGGIGSRVELPVGVQRVVIPRDADPPGSPADQALWCRVVCLLGQGLKVAVTCRPDEIDPQIAPSILGAPFLKDADDLYRYDSELVPIWLNSANLDHGRLGPDVENAILDEASRLDALALGRARKDIAALLKTSLGALDDALARLVRARLERSEKSRVDLGPTPWEYPITDIGAVLDAHVAVLRRIIGAPNTHHDTMALWSAHTHLLQRIELAVRHSPRLSLQSQFEDSGKTTALYTLRHTIQRAMSTSSLSGASLFRETDAHHWGILWDEADTAFHQNTNPELIGIFNAGHDRKFAIVHRQVPKANGEYVTRSFDTFTSIALTSIKAFPSRAMQSRCIVLPMKRATRAETEQLEEFSEEHEELLTEIGRKVARWGADISTLPPMPKKGTGLLNRIWLNWRPLLQIAALAGGTWPARALAAAKADMRRVEGEKDDSVDYALLEAVWGVLARDSSTPRRMHTQDIVHSLLNQDEGRWRTAGKHGREVDEYYLKTGLKKLLPTEGYYSLLKSRRWRPAKDPKGNPLYGYHELHLADAFSRYLGKGLPSLAPPGVEETDDQPQNPQQDSGAETPPREDPFPKGGYMSDLSDTADPTDKNQDTTNCYPEPDASSPSDTVSDSTRHSSDAPDAVSEPSDTVPDQQEGSDTEKDDDNQRFSAKARDVSDKSQIRPPYIKEKEGNENAKGGSTPITFPRGPIGRKLRKG
jgi:hypothetical protein